MKITRWKYLLLLGLLSSCATSGSKDPAAPVPHDAGVIRNFQVLSKTPAFGGATPSGAAGPYQVITGIVHGELDPHSPANAAIVNLKNAPVGPDGYVAYSTDVVILTAAASGGRQTGRVLRRRSIEVASTRTKPSSAAGALDSGKAPAATFPSLLRDGYTIVWSGWQGDLAQTGTSKTAAGRAVGRQLPGGDPKRRQPHDGNEPRGVRSRFRGRLAHHDSPLVSAGRCRRHGFRKPDGQDSRGWVITARSRAACRRGTHRQSRCRAGSTCGPPTAAIR